MKPCGSKRISGINPSFPGLSRSAGQVAHVLLTRSPLRNRLGYPHLFVARLACIRHAASVRPEPGSNSPTYILGLHPPPKRKAVPYMSCVSLHLLCLFYRVPGSPIGSEEPLVHPSDASLPRRRPIRRWPRYLGDIADFWSRCSVVKEPRAPPHAVGASVRRAS